MNQTHNGRLTPNAKILRKAMTKEERRLWYDCLKQLPVTVNRQKVIGRYIVDFYCASAKVVIELDGSQHYEDAALVADLERDAYLEGLGLTVLRHTNLEVNRKFKDVCEDVYRHIMKISTSSPPAGRCRRACPVTDEVDAPRSHNKIKEEAPCFSPKPPRLILLLSAACTSPSARR